MHRDRDFMYAGFIIRRCSGWYYVSHPSESRIVSVDHAFRTRARAEAFIRSLVDHALANPPKPEQTPTLVEVIRELPHKVH